MRKKQPPGEDLFGHTSELKAKPAPPKPPAMVNAEVCGLIAGLPDSFAKVTEALAEIERRCRAATQSTGILTPAQAKRLRDIADEMRALAPTLKGCWQEIDGMIRVIGEPEADLLG